MLLTRDAFYQFVLQRSIQVMIDKDPPKDKNKINRLRTKNKTIDNIPHTSEEYHEL